MPPREVVPISTPTIYALHENPEWFHPSPANSHLRTTNRNVWAAGDVTGHPQFTHVAGAHGSLAASNAVLGLVAG